MVAVAAGLAVPRPCFAHPTTDYRLADLNRSIAARPNDASLYLRRGEVHRLRQAWRSAEVDFLRSRRLDPDLGVVDFYLGRMLFESGRSDEAIAAVDRYLAGSPDDPRGLALRGRLRSANLDHRAAARDFDRAIRAYAESGASAPPEIFLERARALVDADPGQIDRALRGLNEGLELLGRPVTLELAALELESSAGRYEAALERIDRHLAVRPGSTAWRMRRGAVLERGGRHAEAGAEYRRVLAGLERLPDHRRNLPGPARQRTEARSALQRFEHAEDGADE